MITLRDDYTTEDYKTYVHTSYERGEFYNTGLSSYDRMFVSDYDYDKITTVYHDLPACFTGEHCEIACDVDDERKWYEVSHFPSYVDLYRSEEFGNDGWGYPNNREHYRKCHLTCDVSDWFNDSRDYMYRSRHSTETVDDYSENVWRLVDVWHYDRDKQQSSLCSELTCDPWAYPWHKVKDLTKLRLSELQEFTDSAGLAILSSYKATYIEALEGLFGKSPHPLRNLSSAILRKRKQPSKL